MVRSVERALDVIELVAGSADPVALPEITRHLELPRTTAFSIVRTLAKRGMLVLVEGRGYHLGPMARDLSRSYTPPRNLVEIAHPWLEKISGKTLETAFLAIPSQSEIVFIDKVETSQAIRYSAQIGTRRPLYCTAHGKMVLAMRSPAEVDRYLAATKLKPLTERTITEPAAMHRELTRIRRQGFAVSDSEFSPDAYGISAPVLAGAAGPLIAMISAVGPTSRMRPQRRKIAEYLIGIAAVLSAECADLEPMSI